jgi:hypothetical protein
MVARGRASHPPIIELGKVLWRFVLSVDIVRHTQAFVTFQL